MRSAPPPAIQSAVIKAPSGGLSALGAAGPDDALQQWNLILSEYGLRCRLGNREWCTGLTGASDNQVRSTFYFHGPAKSGSGDRIFACTSLGIHDVTTSREAWAASTAYVIGDVVVNDGKYYTCDTDGTSDASGGPTGTGANIVDGTTQWDYTGLVRVLDFAITTGDAGRCIFTSFQTAAGYFLLMADEENGYHVYTASTDTWAAVATGGGGSEVSGLTTTDIAFVGIWKSRVWFVQKDTGSAWYLAAGTIYGAATQLPVTIAAKMGHGGDLVGLWNWTGNDGAGIDDRLVFVGRGGDVAVYEGTDPASASTFGLVGTHYAGALPKGREMVSRFGGDLLILTKNGPTPLSELVVGKGGSGIYTPTKVSNLFNQLMLSKAGTLGWSLHIHPEDNVLLVTYPTTDGATTEQLAMSLVNGSWGRYRDLPIFSAGAGGGKLYFGTADGRVCINDGYLDGVTLADPNAFTAIQWALLTGFSDMGSANFKQVQFIRPTILSEDVSPNISVAAKYRYDLAELGPVAGGTSGGNSWDVGLWDEAVWGGEYNAVQPVMGASGMGVEVAIAARGTATSRTIVVKFDVGFTQGGVM